MNTRDLFIEILVGLPGSGKTHYAEEHGAHVDEYWNGTTTSKDVSYVNFDFKDYKGKSIKKVLGERFIHIINDDHAYIVKNHNTDHWIMDGLFLTNEVQKELVSAIVNNKCINRPIKIQFVYYKEDRETCLFNDQNRGREQLANITISNATYEKPNIEALKVDFPNIEFTIIEKEIYKMNLYDCKFKIHGHYADKDKMRSERWTTGGSWGSWTGESGTISPEPQPTVFQEFDDLIESLCPNITYLQYKKLYGQCVTIEEESESDYYGGTQYYSYFECDLKKLYEMMVEMNLIDLEKYE